MDSIWQIHENRNAEADDELVSRLAQEVSEMRISPVMQPALSAVENQRRAVRWAPLRRTRIEEKLSVLESELQLSRYIKASDRIMQTRSRNVEVVERVNAGGEIRPKVDVKGEREHRLIKNRIYEIYAKFKWKLVERLGEGARDFIALEGVVKNYVFSNWDIYEDVRTKEEKEAGALEAVKSALNRVYRTAENECSDYARILLGLLTEESSGYLEVPRHEICVVEDGRIGLENRISPFLSSTSSLVPRKYKECLNMPLFIQRPNIRDIEQGELGDCYLLAGLIAVVNLNPEKIMKIMRDNGDGTVTVRFMRREVQEDGSRHYVPHYVTVRKTIPVCVGSEMDAFSRGAFWVKMMEKAYAASGLYLGKGREMNKWDYQVVKQYIDTVESGVAYGDISGGNPGLFISLLLGRDSEEHFPVINRTRHTGIRFKKVQHSVNGTRRNQEMQPVRRFSTGKKASSGHRNHLSRRINERRSKSAGMIDFDISYIEAAILENIRQMQDWYYTAEELKLYEDIDTALQDTFYVTFGTKYLGGKRTGKNGETESEGLVGEHAYAILGTHAEWVNGREYLFLLVMNPWAQDGVVYDVTATSIRKRADSLQEERGVFLLDLKTFAKVVSCWETVRKKEN